MPRATSIRAAAFTRAAARAALALCVAAAGCGRQQAAPEGPAAFPEGRCDVTISGAVQRSFTSPGGSMAVASVYWKTDQEMRRYFEWRAQEGDDSELVPQEDVPLVVDQAMARNPRFVTLLLMCSSPDTVVTVLPGLGSRYEQVPFRPAAYVISPAFRVVDAVQGTFAAQTMIQVQPQGPSTKFTPVGFGTLAVDAFDDARVAGSFAYEAQAAEQQIRVKGTFDFKKPAPAPLPAEAAR